MIRLLKPCCPLALCLLSLLLFTPPAAPLPQRDSNSHGAQPSAGSPPSASPAPLLSLLPPSAERTCPSECDDNFRPVCASDGRSYRNECVLRRLICRDNTGLRKLHDGPCIRPTSPPTNDRPSRTRCREECTKIFTPVCGSDGVTYNNLCIMEAESCKAQEEDPSKPTITKAHDGACAVPAGSSSSSSGNRRQTSGLRPSQDLAATVPHAAVISPGSRCEDKCTAGLRPVCGSNGVTYGSQCLFDVAQCRDPTLRKVDDGVCTKDCTIQCSQDSSLVCGNDGVTYLNLCYLIIAQCKDRSVKKASDGACESTPVREACQLTCTTEYAPVCGSNGVTYTNACTLRQATCGLQGLVQLYKGQCRHQ